MLDNVGMSLEKLSISQRTALLTHHKKVRDKHIADRIKPVVWYDDGMSYAGNRAAFIHQWRISSATHTK